MKKLISIILLSMVLVLPLGAKAVSMDIQGECQKPKACVDEKACISTCTIKIKNNNSTNLESFTGTVTAKQENGVTIEKVTAGSDWNIGPVVTGNRSASFTLTPKTTPFTKSESQLVTVEVKHAKDVDCSIELTQGDTTITIEETTQVKTGASLPIAIIAGGLGVALVIYASTKKSKKLYKI